MGRHTRRWKAAIAGLAVTLSLAMPFILISGASTLPTLLFDGMRMNVVMDEATGEETIQLLLDVKVSNVSRWAGVTFHLWYDNTRLTLSDHATNAAVEQTGDGPASDAFFRIDPELYDADQYGHPWNENTYTRDLLHDHEAGFVSMSMMLRRDEEPGETIVLEDSKFDTFLAGGEEADEILYYVNASTTPNGEEDTAHGETTIGTLSFRVAVEDLPYIVAQYGHILNSTDPHSLSNALQHLVRFRKTPGEIASDPWQIHWYTQYGAVQTYSQSRGGAGLFTFAFQNEIISIQAVERAVTVNAYQAYSAGQWSDLPLVLQKYAPMVTLTYADGQRRNVIMPWGMGGAAADYQVLDVNENSFTGNYDPTGNIHPAGGDAVDYTILQKYTWQEDGEVYTYPVPVKVTIAVQEIALTGFAADGLLQSYVLNEQLGNTRNNPGALDLPIEAKVLTDVAPGNVSLRMPIPGWSSMTQNTASGSQWPAAGSMSDIWADGSSGAVYWPAPGENNPAQNMGTYSFAMSETFGGAPAPFAADAVRAAFPWLTLPGDDDSAVYTMPNARRIITGTAAYADANHYLVTYVDTVTEPDGNPRLTLGVNAYESSVTMRAGSLFRVLLPDGTELGTGLGGGTPLVDAYGVEVALDNWLQGGNGEYKTAPAGRGFTLDIWTGNPAQGEFQARRELLRRYINLGGYFFVAVNEDPVEFGWTEFIPVYVSPRTNYFAEHKEYNFIGANARLFDYPGALQTTVTLPPGTYHPVNQDGESLHKDPLTGMVEPNLPGAPLHEEHFGVLTTYDGVTGEQPGRTHTFTVEGQRNTPPWPNVGTIAIPALGAGVTATQFGVSEFKGAALYGAYGTLTNPTAVQAPPGPDMRPAPFTATLLMQDPADTMPAQTEQVRVTFLPKSPGDTVELDGDGNVILARYAARTEGYTDRQDYELIIENLGDTDIYDLAINTLIDNDSDGGGHFIITRPPAAFLPAGGSTTFTLTYVYGLEAGAGAYLDYLDTLYLTSSSKPDALLNTADPDTYLTKFDAALTVHRAQMHRISFQITPPDLSMGHGKIIIGEQYKSGETPAYIMNYGSGSNTAAAGATIHFAVYVADPLYRHISAQLKVTDLAGNPVSGGYVAYSGSAQLDEDTEVFYFTMPAHHVVIHIAFEEPIDSKLRLSRGLLYAGPTGAPPMPDASGTTDLLPYVWYRKTFTEQETTDAGVPGDPEATDRNLMQAGRAGAPDLDPVNRHYLSVIPYDADKAQVYLMLREVVALVASNAPLEDVRVTMYLYGSDVALDTSWNQGGRTGAIYHDTDGATNPPFVSPADNEHYSAVFQSPDPTKSKYVVIELGYDPDGSGSEVEVTRKYYLEIHRAPRTPTVEFGYGNSPHGLIQNADNIAPADKAAALAAFVGNQFRFSGLDAAHIPAALSANERLLATHYWSEAWTPFDAFYEPETGRDAARYDPAKNLDLNEFALFVEVGEAFDDPGMVKLLDSSGRTVGLDPADQLVRAAAEVTLVDTAAATIAARFSMPDPSDPDYAALLAQRTVLLDMGWQGQTVSNWWTSGKQLVLEPDGTPKVDAQGDKVYATIANFQLRPGVYHLIYSYLDFDGENILSVIRPLVVLAPLGNVDGAGAVANADGGDRTAMLRRVTAPLGYDAAVKQYDDRKIYQYRVCDVNNDRNINNIDANHLVLPPDWSYYLYRGYRLD